jgi:hypothetical protein
MIGRIEVAAVGLATLVVLPAVWSCTPGGSVGPCVVNKSGPALALVEVTDRQSGESIESVRLEEVARDGYAPRGLRDAGQREYNTRTIPADAGKFDAGIYSLASFQCDVPCGITRTEGEVQFTVTADGYQPEQVTATAEYQSAAGPGCPTTLSEGREVDVQLEPMEP